MSTRTRYTGASHPVPWEDVGTTEGFGNQYNRLLGVLFDAIGLPLTNIGGTADDVTASMDPVLDAGGLVDGMKVTLTWASNNTGAMTLAINGGSPDPLVTNDGLSLLYGQVEAGTRALLEYVGGSWRMLTGYREIVNVPYDYQVFTSSGTWTKPGGLDPDRMIIVDLWGGGGGGAGGSTGGGGGGGGFVRAEFRAADLPSTVALTIGAGGPPDNSGQSSTFGTYATAWRGGGGHFNGGGGGGGGVMGGGAHANNSVGGAGGLGGGGRGGTYSGGTGADGSWATYAWGGGGGGAGAPSDGGAGGGSVYGGAGGDGESGAGSNRSLYGGNGGNSGQPGTAPGGGGGAGASGARGECRVWIG